MIYINNEKKVKEFKKKINKDNVCIMIDFDKTITSKDSQDSWEASANKQVMGKELSSELNAYYEKYGPMEFDYTMDKKEREKNIIEWYDKCMNLYYKYAISEENLKQSIKNSKLILRKGTKEFLFNMYKNRVPIIILSAGIGNVIEQFLKEEECYYENITIISNFIKFDENGHMIKFSDNIIHSLNKNIDKLGKAIINKKMGKRQYRIAIGDLVEDTCMIGKYPDKQSLKIGFLNGNESKNLKVYRENFDIVLTEDNDFCDLQEYIHGLK